MEGKPLYLADGTMNAFTIGADGALSNGPAISSTWNSDYNTAKQWGINMEELHLFYNLPREISWTGGGPSLVTKGSREGVVNDRHFIYRRPVAQAMQAIFSLKADEDTTPGRYRMNLYMSGMIALSNPNDIPLVVSAGMNTPYILDSMPYNLVWKNQNALGAVYPGAPQNGTPVSPAVADNKLFRGFVGGKPQAGFTLQAGEAGVFGKDTSDPTNYERSIVRGFEKNNNVKLNVADWQLNARNLLPSDKIAFTLNRQAAGGNGPRFSTWLGDRIASNPQKGWQMDQWNVTGAMTAGNAFLDSYIPPTIESPGSVLVSDFVSEPRPILIVSFMKNLENSSPATPPDAFASRPFQLTESAFSGHITSVARFESDQHAMQTVFSAKGMNYIWESLAGGPGGVDLYIGGGRNIGSGGSNVMIQRRIPLTAPLSLGAFQNAIAGGFCDHFYENSLRVSIGGTGLTVGADPMPTTSAAAGALTGNVHALPLVSKAIGNSHSLPHLELDEVYRAGSEVSVARIPANGSAMGSGKIATDHSWMVNTALWDSWYISSIADGTHSSAPSSWKSDNRSSREQFEDLANLSGRLRNTRYLFHPHKSPTDAVTDIFDGNSLKDSAITDLSKYLLVDGAFNVNSTSIQAWTAFLSSIRDQSIKTSNGSDPFNHPLGTIGYAANTATSGTTGDWAGMRNLSNAEIEVLAEKIVDEVKGRGPFLSMADFVNRRPNSATKAQQLLGALQSAIDLSGLNDRFNAGSHVSVGNGFAAYPGSIQDEPVPTRAIGAAGYLTQGDLLTAFGSQIAVRSDTFTIRGYGDARDPSGKVLATAWCEAVVQRVPEYVDPINDPEARAEDPTFSPTNEIFGRRFVICSFRWLQKSEI